MSVQSSYYDRRLLGNKSDVEISRQEASFCEVVEE